MQQLTVILTAAAMTVGMAGYGSIATYASEETASDNTIDVALGYSEPASMDPTIANGADQYEILYHMCEGLVKYKPTSEAVGTNADEMAAEIEPGQAESWDYDESTLTYTFHLRDGIKWSDGQDVKASDFVYSWQRLVNPETASSNETKLNGIVKNATEITQGSKKPEELGVSAPDDKTFVVELENSCPYFLDLCESFSLYPERQDVIEGNDKWTEPETFVCNGGYKMTEWVHDSHITLEKNDQYYNASSIGPDKITFHLSDNETSILAAYQSGDYDYISGVPADQIASLQDSGDLFVNPRLSITYLYLNVDNIPNWKVRAAITLAIDRDNIVDNVTQDGSEAATGLIPSGVTTSDGTSWTKAVDSPMFAWLQEQYSDYDLTDYSERADLAAQLYDEACEEGWNGDTTLDYNYNTSDTNKAIAEAVQADLADVLGMNVTLNNIDSAGYTDTISQGNFYIARLGYGIDFNDAIGYFNLFGTDGSFEYSGWSNEEYDKLRDQAMTMESGADRDDVLEQMEAMMFTDQCFSVCPLYFGTYTYCLKSNVKNVFYSPVNNLTYFGYATV